MINLPDPGLYRTTKAYPGHAQVGIGDRNGDGLGELAFGAYGYDHLVEGEQRVDTGALFLFYGN